MCLRPVARVRVCLQFIDTGRCHVVVVDIAAAAGRTAFRFSQFFLVELAAGQYVDAIRDVAETDSSRC